MKSPNHLETPDLFPDGSMPQSKPVVALGWRELLAKWVARKVGAV